MLRCPQFTTQSSVETPSHRETELVTQLEHRLHSQMLRPIRVHICESELQLFGQVSSWHEKQQAQETAREIAPMYRIRNELRIFPDHGRRTRR
jgi:osmotically-inducible protein OsmY